MFRRTAPHHFLQVVPSHGSRVTLGTSHVEVEWQGLGWDLMTLKKSLLWESPRFCFFFLPPSWFCFKTHHGGAGIWHHHFVSHLAATSRATRSVTHRLLSPSADFNLYMSLSACSAPAAPSPELRRGNPLHLFNLLPLEQQELGEHVVFNYQQSSRSRTTSSRANK